MLSCTSCVTEEVCHCFHSVANLANVWRRSKMAAMFFRDCGRGFSLLRLNDFCWTGGRLVALCLIFTEFFFCFFFTLVPKSCTYISRPLRRSSQRNSYVTIQMFRCSHMSLLSHWRQHWKKESTYREQKQTSGDTLQVADIEYFKVFKSH